MDCLLGEGLGVEEEKNVEGPGDGEEKDEAWSERYLELDSAIAAEVHCLAASADYLLHFQPLWRMYVGVVAHSSEGTVSFAVRLQELSAYIHVS